MKENGINSVDKVPKLNNELKPIHQKDNIRDKKWLETLGADLESAPLSDDDEDDDDQWFVEEVEKWKKARYEARNAAINNRDHMGIGYIINDRIIQYDIADFISLWAESIIGRSSFEDIIDFFDSKEVLSIQVCYPNVEDFRELFRGISVGGFREMLDKLCLGEYGYLTKDEINSKFKELNDILRVSDFRVRYDFYERHTNIERVAEPEY